MNHLRMRVEKLEAIFKTEETRSDKPYRLSDWTDEELDFIILDQNKPLPPDLEEKLQLTDFTYTRTAGMTPEEIEAALDQLWDEDDDPSDDLSAYMDGGISQRLTQQDNPDFDSKPTKKRPQSLDTSEIAVFLHCHKYVG